MKTHDGYIPRAIKDLCNEINRVKGIVKQSLQLGEQQKAMLTDQLSVIMDKVPACFDDAEEARASLLSHKEDAVLETVFARVSDLIGKTAWRDAKGHCAIHEENFENLQIAISDFLVPLLRKAGWFVDADDGLLTCNPVKENHIELRRRTPDKVLEQYMINMAEYQARQRALLSTIQLARRALTTMCDNDELLTPTGMRKLARTTLDKLTGSKETP